MKKVIAAIATVGISLIPAASVHADAYPATDISAAQNQSEYVDANRGNTSNSLSLSYYNATVNYAAQYSVNYAASVTALNENTQSSTNTASLMAGYLNNARSQFSMPVMPYGSVL